MGCTSSNAKDAVSDKPESRVVISGNAEEMSLGSTMDAVKVEDLASPDTTDKDHTVVVTPDLKESPPAQYVEPTPAPTMPTASLSTPMETKPVATLPPLKKGFILKEGHMIKNWRNRFFVLDAGTLTYYESSTDAYPYGVTKKGEMILKDATLKVDRNIIYIQHEQRSSSKGEGLTNLTLEIRYPTEKEEWCAAIRSHIAYINASDV
mmetsp:Transcript_33942/g.58305  ORF Transcript_33942/g.58305 Transcript_33942/m.58305 type:complete len:207 (-) Transcript_33942:96-716(-)|eukprot:CAMPEP_0184994622 /NCGR_PEP_ID=MMETSP1098-20130426/49955_1 /TAXON_ID=89044 /ORGANISM="Spumella elongata, Strain CCAP 955/1" /LENGTH=206 /DNA_ID=CAMNT_0027520721 /DNA_START=61 /DNA_END=681 /DNA_ORIENTATION=+